ncbi:MAG TPA: sigma factor, partial [Ktedonobacterales bacterium]|nr:sigma factor [Ktedonobacterales bacterium]
MSPEELEGELGRLHGAAFGWALACCAGDRSAAEDALQGSYLKILDGRARFDGRASFRTWLFAVVRHTALEQRRRRALARLLPLAALGFAADGRPGPAAALERSERTR